MRSFYIISHIYVTNMKKIQSERIDDIVNCGGVKLHFFQPSGRMLWTVVGRDSEHWLESRTRILFMQELLFSGTF